jgi:hypothetical protein
MGRSEAATRYLAGDVVTVVAIALLLQETRDLARRFSPD